VSIAFRNAMTARRGVSNFALEQALLITEGGEAIAANELAKDLQSNNVDHNGEAWHTRLALQVAPGTMIEGQLDDLSGRFNVNSLTDGNGAADPVSIAVFERLLANLDLPARITPLLVDFIDADTQPEPNGGEDSLYSGLTPAYRPPNRPITSISELQALAGMDAPTYAKLAPQVTALPRDQRQINLCTASGELLDALVNQRQWTGAPAKLAPLRNSGCYPNKTQFQQLFAVNPNDYAKVQGLVAEQSQYFQLSSIVTIGTQEFALYSLLQRLSGTNRAAVRVITRGFAE
jgi:general secretion pathway protein K